jgi:hypothetical protein
MPQPLSPRSVTRARGGHVSETASMARERAQDWARAAKYSSPYTCAGDQAALFTAAAAPYAARGIRKPPSPRPIVPRRAALAKPAPAPAIAQAELLRAALADPQTVLRPFAEAQVDGTAAQRLMDLHARRQQAAPASHAASSPPPPARAPRRRKPAPAPAPEPADPAPAPKPAPKPSSPAPPPAPTSAKPARQGLSLEYSAEGSADVQPAARFLRHHAADVAAMLALLRAAFAKGRQELVDAAAAADPPPAPPSPVLAAALAEAEHSLGCPPAVPLAALGGAVFEVLHEGLPARQLKPRQIYGLEAIAAAHADAAADPEAGTATDPLAVCLNGVRNPACGGCLSWHEFATRTVVGHLMRAPPPDNAPPLPPVAAPRRGSTAQSRRGSRSTLAVPPPAGPPASRGASRGSSRRPSVTVLLNDGEAPPALATAPAPAPRAAPAPATDRMERFAVLWRGAAVLRLVFEHLDTQATRLVPAFRAQQLLMALLTLRGADADTVQARMRALQPHEGPDPLLTLTAFARLALGFFDEEPGAGRPQPEAPPASPRAASVSAVPEVEAQNHA